MQVLLGNNPPLESHSLSANLPHLHPQEQPPQVEACSALLEGHPSRISNSNSSRSRVGDCLEGEHLGKAAQIILHWEEEGCLDRHSRSNSNNSSLKLGQVGC